MNGTMEDIVNVIMPVHNASKWLDRSIGCLINQTYPHWELVAVDDGSTDDSLEILQAWADKDSRIKVYDKRCGGAAKTRAYGMRYVSRDYLLYFDADDAIRNDMIEVSLAAMKATDADVAMPNLIQLDPEGRVLNDNFKTWGRTPGTIIDGEEAFYRSIDWSGTWAHSLYRSELFKKYASDENYLGYFNSAELITRITFLNCKAIVYCDSEYYYYIHSESMSRKVSARYFEYLDTDIRLIQEAKANRQPRHVVAKAEVFAFREMIELWHHYLDNKQAFSEEERKSVLDRFASFQKDFPTANVEEMLSVRPGVTPKLQRLLLLHGWPLCRMSLSAARAVGKKNKLYPWFSEEQLRALK